MDPWVGKIPWRRAWQPITVFLVEESNGQRSLAGYSPWGFKELDTTTVTYSGHLMRRLDSLAKTDAGRDWGQEEKGTTEDEMAGWHH